MISKDTILPRGTKEDSSQDQFSLYSSARDVCNKNKPKLDEGVSRLVALLRGQRTYHQFFVRIELIDLLSSNKVDVNIQIIRVQGVRYNGASADFKETVAKAE